MRNTPNTLPPTKPIKIPLQFTTSIDKVSILQLQQTQSLYHRYRHLPQTHPLHYASNNIIIAQSQSSKTLRPFVSSIMTRQQQSLSQVDNQFQSVQLLNRQFKSSSPQKNSKINFRTSGAGFRQRKITKEKVNKKEQDNSIKKEVIRTKSVNDKLTKTTKNYKINLETNSKREPNNHNQLIAISQNMQKRGPVSVDIVKKPKRLFFGENYKFNIEAQFDYEVEVDEQQLSLWQEKERFQTIGFGVDSNLDKFDEQCLADADGHSFKAKYLNANAKCPIYQQSKYNWVDVKVIDFDSVKSQAIVERLDNNEIRRVGRLSLHHLQSKEIFFWERIKKAKILRRHIIQQQKYLRYIDSREQYFNVIQTLKRDHGLKLSKIIQKQWLNRYSRQIIIFKEMAIKPQKFISMGIKIRNYHPFQQTPPVKAYQSYQAHAQVLLKKHYSKISLFPKAIYRLFEKMDISQCNCINYNLGEGDLEDVVDRQCILVNMMTDKICKKTRQLLVADVTGGLAFAFESKQQQKKFIRMYNYIYCDTLQINVYKHNAQSWVQYILSFTNEVISPPPIINLYLSTNNQALVINPSNTVALNQLLRPLLLLQQKIFSTSDIESQIMFGRQKKIAIKQGRLQQSKRVISEVLDYSLKGVKDYISKLNDKMFYLQKKNYQIYQFSRVGLKDYEKLFETFLLHLNEVNRAIIHRSALFLVISAPLKQSLSQAINNHKIQLAKLIQKQIQGQSEVYKERFRKSEDKIKTVPQIEEQLVNMRNWLLKDCQLFLDQIYCHYILCQQFYGLLDSYFCQYNRKWFQKSMEIILLHCQLIKLINSKLSQLMLIQQCMIEKINSQRQVILKELEEITNKIQIISMYSSLATFNQFYFFTNLTYISLQNHFQHLENINHRQKILKQEISFFPLLLKLQVSLKPYYELWTIAYNLIRLTDCVKTQPIQTLNYNQIKEKSANFSKQLKKLNIYFSSIKNLSAISITDQLIQKANFIEDKLWIIRQFTLQGMIKKQAIKNQILTFLLQDKQVTNQLNLDNLLEAGVQYQRNYVTEHSERAQRIWQLEIRIAKIVTNTKKLQFEFKSKYDVMFVQEKVLLDLSCAVHEQLQQMEIIKDLQEAKYISKKINNVHLKLKNIEDTLLHMITFQQQFFPLFQLLKIQSISENMGKQLSVFKEVERIWKMICAQFIKDNQLWESIETDSYKNRMQNMLKLMIQVDNKANEVINNKRQEFPRLFFIPLNEFKSLLIDQNQVLDGYMQVLLNGVECLLINDHKIRGVKGCNGQLIEFKKQVIVKAVWQYLRQVHEIVCKVVEWQTNIASNPKPKFIVGKCIRILCEWQNLIVEATINKNLPSLKLKAISLIRQMSSVLSSEAQLKSSYIIMFRERIQTLIIQQVTDISSFQYLKYVKYQSTSNNIIQIQTVGFSFPFGNQYQNSSIKPFIVLGDQTALQIIVTSWKMNFGLFIDGLGVETAKQLTQLTLHHHCDYNITFLSVQDILYVLRGYFLSTTRLILVTDSLIDKSVFQVIAQAAFQVRSAIMVEKTLFYLGGQHFNLPKHFKLNLLIYKPWTMNSDEGRICKSLSMKFGILFRRVNWMVPSQKMICRFKLQSIGINHSIVNIFLKMLQLQQGLGIVQNYKMDMVEMVGEFVDKCIKKLITQQYQQLQTFKQIFYRHLPAIHIQFLQQKISKLLLQRSNQHSTIPSSFKDLVHYIQDGFSSKNKIFVIGKPLTGKSHLIKQTFLMMNLPLFEFLISHNDNKKSWKLIPAQIYERSFKKQYKLVIQATQINMRTLQPHLLTDMMIYYHNVICCWKDILINKLKNMDIQDQLKMESITQCQILFSSIRSQRSFKETDWKNSSQIETQSQRQNSFVLSYINILKATLQNCNNIRFNPAQALQFVFNLIIWQTQAIFPYIKLNPAEFKSSLKGQILNLYYDVQKNAWLQWVTLPNNFVCKNSQRLSQLFIATRQNMPLMHYLNTSVGCCNLWIESDCAGMGLHNIINKSITRGLKQFYRLHNRTNNQNISNFISFNTSTFKKQGMFFPKLSQNLVLCIQDVSLSNTPQLYQYMHLLFNHSYEQHLKRHLAKTTFLSTNHHPNNHFSLAIANNTIFLRALSPSQQSKRSIFTYYLDWFFGNTQNPFSKDVRMASRLIVDLSVFLGQVMSIEKQQQLFKDRLIVGLGSVVKVFEGICCSSPRTIKTTNDILQLWYNQWRQMFFDPYYCNHFDFDSLISSFLQKEGSNYEINVVQALNLGMKNTKCQGFNKLPLLKASYSQFYRKIDNQTIYHHLLQLLQSIDYAKYSHLSLIPYRLFINTIAKTIRILNIPRRHLLLYGSKQCSKATIIRISALICFGSDVKPIYQKQGWQKALTKSLNILQKDQKGTCIILKLSQHSSQNFKIVIQEMLSFHHPRSLIFDKSFHYLDELSISSTCSEQYLRIINNFQFFAHCCICYPEVSLKELRTNSELILRKVQLMNVNENFTDENIDIARLSIGKHYDNFKVINEITRIMEGLGMSITRSQFIKFNQLIKHYYERANIMINNRQNAIILAIQHIRLTQKHKQKIQNDLIQLKAKLTGLNSKITDLKLDYQNYERHYSEKNYIYNKHEVQCRQQTRKTQLIKDQVDHEMDKVLPLLKQAEQAMAKVTRDDINQLRSFPNPALAAVKVVESLVFLFNEMSMVKEKVVEGQKIKDFWQYAKKFILNDKLLKRVSEFNQQRIKTLPHAIILNLRDIIKRPEFAQEKVFKASIAAGNLSLWIKAIVAVYDVMQIMEPKKKFLNQALESLNITKVNLDIQNNALMDFKGIVDKKKLKYEHEVSQQKKMIIHKKQLERYISNGNTLLSLLHNRQKEWQLEISIKLMQMRELVKQQSIFVAFCILFQTKLQNPFIEQQLTQQLSAFFKPETLYSQKYKLIALREYQSILLQTHQSSKLVFPLCQSFYKCIIAFNQLLRLKQKFILIHDQTYLLAEFLDDNFKKQFNSMYQIKLIDCFQFINISDVMELLDKERQEYSEGTTDSIITLYLFYNLQHCSLFIDNLRFIMQELKQQHFIVVVNEKTLQLVEAIRKQGLQFNIQLHLTEQILSYTLRHAFSSPLHQLQALSRTYQLNNLKDELLKTFCSCDNIILDQKGYDKWMQIHQLEIKAEQNKTPIKQISKIQEQNIKQIISVMSAHKHLTLKSLKKLIIDYKKQQEELSQNPMLQAFADRLPQILLKHPLSCIKVVQPQNMLINSLAFFMLKLNINEELKRPAHQQNKQQGIRKTNFFNSKYLLSNFSYLTYCFKQNLNAYICPTDKYKLKQTIQEFTMVEQAFRQQNFQQLLQRQQWNNIYILPECGTFKTDQIIILQQQALKEVLSPNIQIDNYEQFYFLEQTIGANHSQYDNSKYPSYIQIYLFGRKIIQSSHHPNTWAASLRNILKGAKIGSIKQMNVKGGAVSHSEDIYISWLGRQWVCFRSQEKQMMGQQIQREIMRCLLRD